MCESGANLIGKVVIVTGGSSGIGLEAAKNLAALGAKVIIASRNITKLIKAKEEIIKATGNNKVNYKQIDLASLKSVRNFATDIINSEGRLDVLVNNAGAVGLPDKLSEDGLNLMMQVNYFAVFLLTYLLLPLLKSSSPSRIINSSATSAYIGSIDFEHWNDLNRYSPIEALSNSKLADALFTEELSRRLQNTGVTANSFDPFIVPGTNLLEDKPVLKHFLNLFGLIFGQSKNEVGKQVAFLASEPRLQSISGTHFKFCCIWPKHWLTKDKNFTNELWTQTKTLLKIYDDVN